MINQKLQGIKPNKNLILPSPISIHPQILGEYLFAPTVNNNLFNNNIMPHTAIYNLFNTKTMNHAVGANKHSPYSICNNIPVLPVCNKEELNDKYSIH